MKVFKASRCSRAEDSEPEPPYDNQPIFFFPDKCPHCQGKGCMMCEEQTTSIHATRLRDMTIKREP